MTVKDKAVQKQLQSRDLQFNDLIRLRDAGRTVSSFLTPKAFKLLKISKFCDLVDSEVLRRCSVVRIVRTTRKK